eukprot:1177245-Prorocentrum_minimum.AAC.5
MAAHDPRQPVFVLHTTPSHPPFCRFGATAWARRTAGRWTWIHPPGLWIHPPGLWIVAGPRDGGHGFTLQGCVFTLQGCGFTLQGCGLLQDRGTVDHSARLQDVYTEALLTARTSDNLPVVPDHFPLPIYKHTPAQAPPSAVRTPTHTHVEYSPSAVFYWSHMRNILSRWRSIGALLPV